MWLTRDALLLSSLSAQPRFGSMHSSRSGQGERCGVEYTAHIKHSSHSLLCPGPAFTRPWQGAGFFAQSKALAGCWNLCRVSETQCGRSWQLGLSQVWFLVTGTDRIAPLPPGPQAHVLCFVTSQGWDCYFTAMGQNSKCRHR